MFRTAFAQIQPYRWHRMNAKTALIAIFVGGFGGVVFLGAALGLPPLPDGWFAKLPNWPVFALLCLLVATFWREDLSRPTGFRIAAAYAAIMLFFAVTLRAAISDSTGVPWVILGLLPVQDAADYYGEALDLLTRGEIETLRGRTIHSAILATLLGATGFSLHAVALIQTCAAGFSAALAGISVWRSLGAAPALMVVAFLYSFYHYFVGSTMTETTGFVAGTLAFAILCEAVRLRVRLLFLVGLAALAFALSVRVGPLFLLPALILWSGYGYRGMRRYDFRMPVMAVCVVGAVFAANNALNARLAPTSGGSFANGPDSIYALVASGKAMLGLKPADTLLENTRWLQIYRDFPELNDMPLDEKVARKFEIMYDQLLWFPHAIVVGAIPEWNNYFFSLQIMPFQSSYGNRIARTIVVLFTVIGLIAVCRPKGSMLRWFGLVSNLGIFASVPFLIGGETRVFAATLGYTAMLPAFGVSVTAARIGKVFAPSSAGGAGHAVVLASVAGIALLLVPIAFGAYVYAAAFPRETAPAACRAGERGMVYWPSQGAARGFQPSGSGMVFAAPRITLGELAERVSAQPETQKVPTLRALSRYADEGTAMIYYSLDQAVSTAKVLVVPQPQAFSHDGPIGVCAVFEQGVWVAMRTVSASSR